MGLGKRGRICDEIPAPFLKNVTFLFTFKINLKLQSKQPLSAFFVGMTCIELSICNGRIGTLPIGVYLSYEIMARVHSATGFRVLS
jgi:hypothetical protein